jgi:hypothetical protein
MKLTELMDDTYPHQFKKMNGEDYAGAFKSSSGEVVRVDMQLHEGLSNTVYEINFTRKGEYHTTGGGDALKILATVLKIIKEFKTAANPAFITFSADNSEISKVKLYRRMSKTLASTYGYTDISKTYNDIGISDDIKKWFSESISTFKTSEQFLLALKDVIK